MNIFEEDDDRIKLLQLLNAELREGGFEVFAWCLMSNHIHLLARGPFECIPNAMRKALSPYAKFFNRKYNHVGHLFQGRYSSIPVIDDQQLLETIRYIHRNPCEAGICHYEQYRWSSYGAYIANTRTNATALLPCEVTLALEMLGGIEAFSRFHEDRTPLKSEHSSAGASSTSPTDMAAKSLAESLLGTQRFSTLPSLGKVERDACLAILKESGLSVRQIERITGIGRNIIQRALI